MKDIEGNINELIDIIISLRKEKDQDVCCYPASAINKELCIHKCKECTEDYYNKMRNEMMQKYGINE